MKYDKGKMAYILQFYQQWKNYTIQFSGLQQNLDI